MYEDIPHLLTPVVVDPKQAANALRWAVREMEERYKTLAEPTACATSSSTTATSAHAVEERGRAPRATTRSSRRTLPFIVVVIDELADLMMVAGNEVEESIARLAQMARAVGHPPDPGHAAAVGGRHHRPDQGEPARRGSPSGCRRRSTRARFSTATAPSSCSARATCCSCRRPRRAFVRLHGPYISEQETRAAGQLPAQAGQAGLRHAHHRGREAAPDAVEFEKDDLYDEAARIVVSSGQASISYLQRRLRIGFSRAARLIDMMEAEGRVGRLGRQAARGAGAEGLLRRGRSAGPVMPAADDAAEHRAEGHRGGRGVGGGRASRGSAGNRPAGLRSAVARERALAGRARPAGRRRSAGARRITAYEEIVRRSPRAATQTTPSASRGAGALAPRRSALPVDRGRRGDCSKRRSRIPVQFAGSRRRIRLKQLSPRLASRGPATPPPTPGRARAGGVQSPGARESLRPPTSLPVLASRALDVPAVSRASQRRRPSTIGQRRRTGWLPGTPAAWARPPAGPRATAAATCHCRCAAHRSRSRAGPRIPRP